MRHVDLCSGIGGFALGFQWAGLSEPVLFCDVDDWCRRVLRKHWSDVPIAKDVKELANDPEGLVPDCDVLTAGYPCTPFSVAGKRRGEKDDRHIWPEIRTIVQAKRPTWCVFENVYGHIKLGLDEVLSDLESCSYSTQAFCVPAVSVDAPHRRDRVWIIARIVENTRHGTGGNKWVAETGQDASGEWAANTSQASGSGEQSKTVADTDSQRPVQRKHEKRSRHKKRVSSGRGEGSRQRLYTVAHADSSGLQGGAQTRNDEKNRAQPDDKQFKRRSGAHKSRTGRPTFWKPEPNVGRVAHGIPRRVDRIRGLGNAIVPAIAQQIGETIKKVEQGCIDA